MAQEHIGPATDDPPGIDGDARTAKPAASAPLETIPSSAPAATSPDADPASREAPLSSRRRFLRYLLGFSAVSTLALVATPVVAFLVPPKTGTAGTGGKVPVGKLADLPLGKGKVVAMGSKPAIVINTDQGVKAYSAICTHLGCIVAFDDTAGLIVCPCHDGRFSPATGAVVSGPPPAPLDSIAVSVEGDDISLVSG